MKKMFVAIFIISFYSCNDNAGINVTTESASDTITNVTNPGVGAASDDTTVKD